MDRLFPSANDLIINFWGICLEFGIWSLGLICYLVLGPPAGGWNFLKPAFLVKNSNF